jgi:serine/threonine-protein kinase RsbW
MATVELRFSALPAHVRTARLVAAAVARRSGLDDDLLDEVRLAVGEACSRAVDLHRRHCPHQPVSVSLTDGPDSFAVAVTDRGGDDEPSSDEALAALRRALRAGPEAEGLAEGLPAGVGLAVISGLVDDVTVTSGQDGLVVTMTWPTKGTGGRR